MLHHKIPAFFIFLLLLAAKSFNSHAQTIEELHQKINLEDTIFLNKNWEECNRKEHRFFRVCSFDSTTMPSQKLIKIQDYYKNGNLLGSGFITENDHRLIGEFKYFDRKGRLRHVEIYDFANTSQFFDISKYKEDIPHCDFANAFLLIDFFKKGGIRSIGFRNGNEDCAGRMCTWKFYLSPKHELFRLMDFDNGLLNGRAFTYHYNGQLWKERYYKYGTKTGTWKTYSSSGHLKKSESFDN